MMYKTLMKIWNEKEQSPEKFERYESLKTKYQMKIFYLLSRYRPKANKQLPPKEKNEK